MGMRLCYEAGAVLFLSLIHIYKEAQEYYARLTAFYQQFRRIGNNYNQCVKTIHTIYGEKKSLAFLYKLAEETRKLEEMCIRDSLYTVFNRYIARSIRRYFRMSQYLCRTVIHLYLIIGNHSRCV